MNLLGEKGQLIANKIDADVKVLNDSVALVFESAAKEMIDVFKFFNATKKSLKGDYDSLKRPSKQTPRP